MSDVVVSFAFDAEGDAESIDFDLWQRGYRTDVYVRIGDEYFRLAAYAPNRLTKDFEVEMRTCGFYLPEPNLILVPEVTKQQIVAAVNRIYHESVFFQQLKCVEDEVVARLRVQPPNS